MREAILDILSKSDKALTSIEISEQLEIKDAKLMTELLTELNELVEEFLIYRSNKDKYMLFENSHLKKGRLSITTKGYGFVILENEDDIFISEKNLRGALNNDIVVVEPIPVKNGKTEGRIVRVLKKQNNLVIGEFDRVDGHPIFKPDDEKLKIQILLSDEETKDLVPGHKIEVSLVKELGKYKYKGELVRIIGHKNDPGVDVLSIVYKYGINDKFSDEVLEELESIPEEVMESETIGRRDLRNEVIFTIDGDDTKDIDDAISIKKKGENYILGVHIADVSYYVKEGTKLYDEAYSRGTSIYLVDRVIPMLPHKLSNGICSLNPKVDRLAVSCVMEIDKNGKVIDHEIFESVIKSRIQMTYKNVNKILHNEEIPEGYEEYVDNLRLMEELAKILRKNKLDRGYLDFDASEAKILVDEKGKPYDVILRIQDDAENLIEDFMIVANETVATHVFWMGLPFVYRVHEIPEEEKVKEFLNSISRLGYKVTGERHFEEPKVMKSILDQLKDKEEFPILSMMLLRCMKKAVYKDENLGHYGLASKCYTHFTSPIRRFPDTTVHNLLRKYIFNVPDEKELNKLIDYWKANLPELCEHTSQKERDSIDCERDVESMKMAEYMEDHIGEEYEGVISSIMSFGMFVELPNLIEGLVRISDIKGDYYIYDDSTKTLRGQHKKKEFRMGQKVKVVVVAASKENSTIDFNLVEEKKVKENGNTKQKSKI